MDSCSKFWGNLEGIRGSPGEIQHIGWKIPRVYRVKHSCSSTQSWGNVLPSIGKLRDQNSQGCPLLFSNRNLGSFCA